MLLHPKTIDALRVCGWKVSVGKTYAVRDFPNGAQARVYGSATWKVTRGRHHIASGAETDPCLAAAAASEAARGLS